MVCISDFEIVFKYFKKKPEVIAMTIKWKELKAKSKNYKCGPIWKLHTPKIDIPIKFVKYNIEVDNTIVTRQAMCNYRCYFIQAILKYLYI